MNSILIRFTDSKYADSYRSGNLSFSSLYSFWDLRRNKIPYEKAPFASKEELLKAANDKQQDFSEGISLEIPSSILAESKDFYPHICNDTIRARIDAYGYCKLLCFYRVDITGSVIQNLPSEMFNFGNTVIVVKDEKEFEKSVINAIAKRGEDCVLGDVSYHDVWTKPREHSVTLISEEPFSLYRPRGFIIRDILDVLISMFISKPRESIASAGCPMYMTMRGKILT